MRDIYFRCSACRKSLVIDARAAGHIARCPDCEAQLQVPKRSDVPPFILKWFRYILAPVAVMAVVVSLDAVWFDRSAATPFQQADAQAPDEGKPAFAATSRNVTSAADPQSAARLVEMAAENQRLAEEHRTARRQLEEMGNWILNTFSGKFPLPDRLVTRLRLPAVTEDFTLHPDVAEVLRINGAEESLINDAFTTTRNTLAQYEDALLTVTQYDQNKVTLYVPPFAEDGELLREDLFGALEATLGGARFDRFMDMTQDEMMRQFHYFGAASRTMIFQVTYPDNGRDPPYLVVKDGWVIPNGPSSRSIQVTESSVRELPKQYAMYVAYLPQTIAAYAVK